MSFDAIVTNPGRLRILTALAVEQQQDFVELRRRTHLTDGNLSSHAKRLHGAGMIDIDKTFREGKPVTQFRLTTEGRRALESHVRRLMAALSTRRIDTTDRPLAVPAPASREALEPVPVGVADEWVD
jgi:DNA-binding MarR family transcriptional regulator